MAPGAYTLERLLQREIKLYQDYLRIVSEERAHTTRFNSEKLSELTQKREIALFDMQRAHDERMEFCAQFPESKGVKLTELIQRHYAGEERSRLMTLAKTLRRGAAEAQKKTRDFGLITRFGLGMAEGLMSIFWSATQHVTRSYSRKGMVREDATPSGTRESSVLKKA